MMGLDELHYFWLDCSRRRKIQLGSHLASLKAIKDSGMPFEMIETQRVWVEEATKKLAHANDMVVFFETQMDPP